MGKKWVRNLLRRRVFVILLLLLQIALMVGAVYNSGQTYRWVYQHFGGATCHIHGAQSHLQAPVGCYYFKLSAVWRASVCADSIAGLYYEL